MLPTSLLNPRRSSPLSRLALATVAFATVFDVPAAHGQGSGGADRAFAVATQSSSQIAQARALVHEILTRRTRVTNAGVTTEQAANIPGMSVAVAVEGRIVWSEGFGFANVEQSTPVTSLTRFRIGSVSKLLTAAALMRLEEQGKISLDDPIQRYVPEFPRKQGVITPRMLAGHLSGIRHYIGSDFAINRPFRSLTEGLKIFADDSLVAPPGTRYSYSSFGYNLLGVAIERASGQSFLDALQGLVLGPLALTHTIGDYRDSLILGRAAPYERGRDGRAINAPDDDVSYKWPSGGILSTCDDLVRFATAHMSPGFLQAQSLRTMFTTQRNAAGVATAVGIGWRIGTDSAGRRFYHHGGTATGGRAVVVMYPDAHIAIAMLSNMVAPYDERDATRIAALFLP